jgi:shikimate dehydrogenase
MPLLDYLLPTAEAIGAGNTIVIEDGKLLGYNTDADGAMLPLEKLTTLAGESCAVIGSGGAARAIIYGLRQRQANVTIYARNHQQASKLADEFGVRAMPLEKLASSDAKILINTTPVGMRGYREGESILPSEWLNHGQIVYDLVYNPLSTRLLRDAEKAGCRTLGGLDMLIAQAALQFKLWTGRDANHQLMHSVALEKLSHDN